MAYSTTSSLRRGPGAFTDDRPRAEMRSGDMPRSRIRQRAGHFPLRVIGGWVVRLLGAGILLALTGIWLQSGGLTGITGAAALFTSFGRLAGLLGAYALLIQLLLLARAPFLEWTASFDRLASWHKVNGKIAIFLILAHVAFITTGYALLGHLSILTQFLLFLHTYPGMIAALIGTILLLLAVITSIAIVRRRLGYQTWFLVHLMAYSAVALTWFHQIPTGQVFLGHPLAIAFWIALYVVTLQLVVIFRFAQPLVRNLWYRLRVAEVIEEAQGVVSLRFTGHNLAALRARAGQYFSWRFLDWDRWQEAHPFSLSAAPDGRSLRITVKDLGDFSRDIREIKPGTRVMIEGPFGSFTEAARKSDRVALIAGGVGITPIRALLEEMTGDLVLVYRVTHERELIFRDELERLARERGGITIHYVVGDRRKVGNEHLLSPQHLRDLIPDIKRREIYLCGPQGLMNAVRSSIERAGVPPKHIHSDEFEF